MPKQNGANNGDLDGLDGLEESVRKNLNCDQASESDTNSNRPPPVRNPISNFNVNNSDAIFRVNELCNLLIPECTSTYPAVKPSPCTPIPL